MKNLIQTVKGTREFYPQEMGIRIRLYDTIRKVSESFGYQEYDGPFLEKIDLYAAKSGEELVKEQAFVFPDRGGDLITLRPELTPSLARMVAQKQGELVYPLRWWSFGPFWRYEKPQKGRAREFFQWNIDLIGSNAAEADAELVAICAAFFKEIGLGSDKVQIFINDRQLMDSEFERIGILASQKKTALHLIDRREKMSAAAWDEYAFNEGISAESLLSLKTLLDNPEIWKKSATLVRIFKIMEAMGYREYFTYDPRIVRGLDYYTGTVFEAKEIGKEGRSILGGGHYDNLVGDVGGDPLPGVGFAMGDMMLAVVLEKFGLIAGAPKPAANVLVTVYDEALLPSSFSVANQLRLGGLQVIAYPEAAKLNKQIKFADRSGIRIAVFLGPDEAAAGQVTVKDLVTRTQQLVDLADAPRIIQEMLAVPPAV